jgi:D-alanine-D-alanine ligase-like ATP-grasp enzyme
MTEHSISAVNTLGLDFGAVDLIVAKDGRVYVLEVNTAPGIEGITLEKYVKAFQNYETH